MPLPFGEGHSSEIFSCGAGDGGLGKTLIIYVPSPFFFNKKKSIGGMVKRKQSVSMSFKKEGYSINNNEEMYIIINLNSVNKLVSNSTFVKTKNKRLNKPKVIYNE